MTASVVPPLGQTRKIRAGGHFYSNKAGYVLALRLFSSSDEDIVDTTHRLAIIGYVVMGVLAFAWLGRLVPLPAAAALSLLMCFLRPS